MARFTPNGPTVTLHVDTSEYHKALREVRRSARRLTLRMWWNRSWPWVALWVAYLAVTAVWVVA